MRRIAIYVLTTFVVLSLLSSCKKELPTEAGEWKDSYIVEFALTVQGKTYQGAIEGNKITVQIPEGIDLKGAAVQCKLSEGASIEPDPKSVSDWSTERKFIVTSKSQENRKYMYSPVFTKPIQVGSIVLATQKDVDKFKGTKITAIEGDLIIGTARGEKITNLDSLAYLKQVGGALKINASYDGVDFSGLNSLETVGSFFLGTCLDTSKCEKVKEVSLPSLSEVNGDFVVRCGTVESVSIPKVKSIKGEVFVTSRTLKSVVVSSLEEVRGSLVLHGAMKTKVLNSGQIWYASEAAIEAVCFDVLSSVGGKLEVQYFRRLESVYFPVLNRIGGSLKINNILKLGSIALSELTEVGGFESSSNSELKQISLPKLKKCMGYFYVDGGQSPFEFDISSLEIQDADMCLAKLPCEEVRLSPLFDLRGHTLEISMCYELNKLSGPSTLDGNLKFDWMDGMDEFTVEGISKLMGSLVIQNSHYSKFSFPFTEIEGGLNWNCNNNTIDMKSLKKIGRLNITSDGKDKYDFSGLKEIVGESSFTLNSPSFINLSSLEKVGNNFKVTLSSGAKGGSFTCPKLSNVAGDFRFTRAINKKYPIEEYTVDFSGLTSVWSVTITEQKWLTDFTMFKGLFPEENPAIAAAEKWTVSGCGYNPTFDNMKKGLYTKELYDKYKAEHTDYND